VRWLFTPFDPVLADSRLKQSSSVELKGKLTGLSGQWILEADFDSLQAVEANWSALGTLVRDRSGVPSLSRTTALVGARPRVWDQLDLRGDMGSTVAILDSGCDAASDNLGDVDYDNADNPLLHAGDADDWSDASGGMSADTRIRIVGWHDVTNDVSGSDGPYDYHYHGTALASAAFASGRNADEHRGVAPAGRFVVVKTYNFEGRWEVWASDLLLGIQWVLDHVQSHHIHACLIGAVWDEDLGISEAVNALLDAGVAVIAPAGNDRNGSMGWPARIDGVICVAATDADGQVAAYNTPGSSLDLRPDLVAPGGGSDPLTGPIVCDDNEPDDTYRGRVGTSIAAAHVAGAVSLISQVLRESGRPWRYERSQTKWLQELLRATAVETQAAEPGAAAVPPLDRGGHDPIEGFGLLQVDAAVNAVRRSLWPGEEENFILGSPVNSSAVWSARMPVSAGDDLRLELTVPSSADYDLLVYREDPDGYMLVASSCTPGLGVLETLDLNGLSTSNYLLVVKRIAGEGQGRLKSIVNFLGDTAWPILLSDQAASRPMPYDADGDGEQEVFLTYNVAILDTGHLISMNSANGRPRSPFPRDFFTSTIRKGQLTGAAIADLGSGPQIVIGSQFGSVYAMNLSGDFTAQAEVTPALPTSAPSVWGTGAQSRVVVGTTEGAAILEPSGGIVDRWLLGGASNGDLALGDLNGDGIEEVLVSVASTIHARTMDGSPLNGWPIVEDASSSLTPPVIFGGGSEPMVFAGELLAGGGARILGLSANGSALSGFPAQLSEEGSILALGNPIVSRVENTSPTILCAVLVAASDGTIISRVHQVDLAGRDTPWARVSLTGPVFRDSSFEVLRSDLSPVCVGDMVASGGPEVYFSLQLSWREKETQQLNELRYGSTRRIVAYHQGVIDPRLQWDLASSHPIDEAKAQILPAISWKLAPVISDLDGDGYAEMLVDRGFRVFLHEGESVTTPSNYWSTPRNGHTRRACYECGDQPKIASATPPAKPSSLALRVSPNPFNPRTVLRLSSARSGWLRLYLVDAKGRRLKDWGCRLEAGVLHEEVLEATDHDGIKLASGVYRVVAEMNGQFVSRSVTLVR
jgi:subtilisin family serine protease